MKDGKDILSRKHNNKKQPGLRQGLQTVGPGVVARAAGGGQTLDLRGEPRGTAVGRCTIAHK